MPKTPTKVAGRAPKADILPSSQVLSDPEGNRSPPTTTTHKDAKPDLAAFADTVQAALLKKGMNASQLARLIWGETQDGRGYNVAKNRDRIMYYLRGQSFPNEENLEKLARALGLNVEELKGMRPVQGLVVSRPRSNGPGQEIQMFVQDAIPGRALLQVNKMMRTTTAIAVIQLIEELEGTGTRAAAAA